MGFSSRTLLALLFLTTLIYTVLAADESGATSFLTQASCTLPEPGLPLCSFEGQADFYGLGVRMGIYFTWLTSWIANNFIADEIAGSLDTNAVFLLAISVTVIYNSIHHQLRIIDALVLLQLCYGFLFGVMSLWGYRTMYYHRMGAAGRSRFGGFGTHLRLLLMTAISAYAVWFWFEGLDDGLIECNKREACGGLKTFFFARVKLYGWIRTFYQISAVGCVLYYGVMTAVAIIWLAVRCLRFVRQGREGWTSGFEGREDVEIGLTQREYVCTFSCTKEYKLTSSDRLSYAYLALAGFNLFWMLFSALTVEFTLNFNHMTNVLGEHGLSGPGQQLPLLIGLFSFLRICWILFKDKYLDSGGKPRDRPEQDNSLPRTSTAQSDKAVPNTTTSPPHPSVLPKNPHPNSIPLLAAHTDRSLAQRVLIVYLPWLSDFAFFHKRQGQGFEAVRRGSEGLEMQRAGYENERKGGNVDVESLGSPGLGAAKELEI